MKALHEEFRDIFKHTPEGIMIARVFEREDRDGNPITSFFPFSPQETTANKIDAILTALKEKYDTSIKFVNQAMENFIIDSRLKSVENEGQRNLFYEKMFQLYDFNKSSYRNDSLGHFRSYTVQGRHTIFDDMNENKLQDTYLFSL